MPELSFAVQGVESVAAAVAPMLAFKLRIDNARPAEAVHAVLLRCQIQIEAPRRRYTSAEQERLFDLFGPPPDWGRTLRRMLWAQVQINVPGFVDGTLVELPVACSYDLDAAVTKYFRGLDDGDIPLRLLFSGTAFYASQGQGLQVMQIPWDKEALFRLPVDTWQAMMDRHYPNRAWLSLRRDVVDRLTRYKARSGFTNWDETLESLLAAAQEKVTL